MNPRRTARVRRAAAHGPTAAIALLGMGHGLPAILVAVLGITGVTVVTALANHLFWLWALAQPRRDLTRLGRMTGSLESAERLAAQLREARRDVLDARSRHAGDTAPLRADENNAKP